MFFLSFFFFTDFFLIPKLKKNNNNKKKNKKLKMAAHNWGLTESYFDRNWKLEVWIDKTES